MDDKIIIVIISFFNYLRASQLKKRKEVDMYIFKPFLPLVMAKMVGPAPLKNAPWAPLSMDALIISIMPGMIAHLGYIIKVDDSKDRKTY